MRWIQKAAHEAHRRDLWKVLALYAGVSWGALEVVGLFVERGILPEGAFLGTLIVLVTFLPVFLITAFVQRGLPGWLDPLPEEESGAAGLPGKSRRLRELLTWRRVVAAGIFALAMVGVGAGGYMAMRILGIGSPGTLLAQGLIEEGERIIVADFQSTAPALPGQVVTEALRINLGQSSTIRPLSNAELRGVLARMETDPEEALDEERAREAAEREGIKAIVSGEVTPVGGRFLLTARLVETAHARDLVSFQETARDTTRLLDAIDRLGNSIRDKAGESLRSIQANVPLHEVTTSSLEALRLYSQAEEVDRVGDSEQAIYLLREAVRVDPEFAMAYRKLGVQLDNSRTDPAEQALAYTRAFELRDQLPPLERFLADASYYQNVTGDLDGAANAYETVLNQDPANGVALNNLGIHFLRIGDPEGAERLFRQAIENEASNANYVNLVRALFAQERGPAVEEVLLEWETAFPESSEPSRDRALLAFRNRQYARADSLAVQMMTRFPGDFTGVFFGTAIRWAAAGIEGRWRESEAIANTFIQQGKVSGALAWAVTGEMIRAGSMVYLLSDTPMGVATFNGARAEHPLSSMPPLNRSYLPLARTALILGIPETADSLLKEFEANIPASARGELQEEDPREVQALLAVARGDLQQGIEGLTRLKEDCETLCRVRARFSLGEAYEQAGDLEAAAAAYEDYLTYPALDRLQADGFRIPPATLRIAELNDELGNAAEAASWYRRFADLWANADPELRPKAEEARKRARELAGGG